MPPHRPGSNGFPPGRRSAPAPTQRPAPPTGHQAWPPAPGELPPPRTTARYDAVPAQRSPADARAADAAARVELASQARRRRTRRILIAFGVVLGLFILIGALNRPDSSTPAVADQAPAAAPAAADPAAAPAAPAASDSITYEVTGGGAAISATSVTYVADQNLGQEQVNGSVELPWSKMVTIPDNGFRPLSIVAQSGSQNRGASITCRILDGAGNELASNTSTGPYAVVTCSSS